MSGFNSSCVFVLHIESTASHLHEQTLGKSEIHAMESAMDLSPYN
jgi:hypothetical protein